MVGPDRDPYLLIFRDGRGPGPRTSGRTSCRLGHVIPRPASGSPDGVFGGWTWDGTTLRADIDRYGLHPLYYFSRPDRFAISPSIPTLLGLGAPRELDDAALAVFLRLGFFLGEDTPFRAIRALPPNGTLEWRDGRLHVGGSLVLPPHQALARDAAVDGFIDLFRAAITRRARPSEEIAVPLSGGRDSRHILLELCRGGRTPRFCVTLEPWAPYRSEAPIARAVADAVGAAHVVLPQRGSRLEAERRKNVLTNFCADEHAWYLPLGDYLPGRVRYLYDGIGGDVLSAGLFLTPERHAFFESGRLEALAADLMGQGRSAVEALVAPAWAVRLGREIAIARVAAELARHAEAANPTGSFYFWNRTRREIALAPYRILSRGVEVLSPYLDHDVFDLLASLPASHFLDHQFHSDTIRRAFPRIAHVSYKEAADPREARLEFLKFVTRTAGFALQRARSGTQPANGGLIIRRSLLAGLTGDTWRFDWRTATFAIYLLQLGQLEQRPPMLDPDSCEPETA